MRLRSGRRHAFALVRADPRSGQVISDIVGDLRDLHLLQMRDCVRVILLFVRRYPEPQVCGHSFLRMRSRIGFHGGKRRGRGGLPVRTHQCPKVLLRRLRKQRATPEDRDSLCPTVPHRHWQASAGSPRADNRPYWDRSRRNSREIPPERHRSPRAARRKCRASHAPTVRPAHPADEAQPPALAQSAAPAGVFSARLPKGRRTRAAFAPAPPPRSAPVSAVPVSAPPRPTLRQPVPQRAPRPRAAPHPNNIEEPPRARLTAAEKSRPVHPRRARRVPSSRTTAPRHSPPRLRDRAFLPRRGAQPPMPEVSAVLGIAPLHPRQHRGSAAPVPCRRPSGIPRRPLRIVPPRPPASPPTLP